MENDLVEPADLFRAVQASGARALLIGRQALVALGAPVLTGDYDFWLHIDDIELFNAALQPLGLVPNKTPEGARGSGRYVLENGERVDVLIAQTAFTQRGKAIHFSEVWDRRQELPGIAMRVMLPAVTDLISTKEWSMRAKDLQDIDWLKTLLPKDDA